jgi:hypothetical protein
VEQVQRLKIPKRRELAIFASEMAEKGRWWGRNLHAKFSMETQRNRKSHGSCENGSVTVGQLLRYEKMNNRRPCGAHAPLTTPCKDISQIIIMALRFFDCFVLLISLEEVRTKKKEIIQVPLSII